MLAKTLKPLLCASAGLAAALGLNHAVANAQPYDSDHYPAYDTDSYPAYDSGYVYSDGAEVGGVTVYAHPYGPRTWNGAPVVVARATRVVNTGDLDLSTGWGVHELRDRVERAAADACNELDNQWTVGLYPLPDENTTDCIRNAADGAMYRAGLY